MKVILSRKGFDASNGGIASPIFEDGTMLSFPIPTKDKDTFDDLRYDGVTYTTILDDLNYKGGMHCHIDPDLDNSKRVNPVKSWVPAFGQSSSAASYLKNIGIEKGDLFLFFGNFHFVKNKDGHFRYIHRSGDFYKDNDLQVIWGYLQVGEILEEASELEKLWWHPHSSKEKINNTHNMIFKASKRLSFDKSKSGAGCLKFNYDRVLTAEKCNKATWKYNKVYDPEHILCNRKNSAKDPDNGIYYAGIWQEMCLVESEECIEWVKNVLM